MLRALAVGASIVVLGAVSVAWYFGQSSNDLAQCSGSTVVGGDIGGPFELVNASGQTVTDVDVITEPSLVYFGYTYCPDVCPFDVSRNADAVDLLAQQGLSATPVFVTIDPRRDTPEIISDYAENMHEKMIALTGSDQQIAQASRAYKTYYKAQDDGTDEYLVDHSTFTYLVFPDVGFVEFFRRDVTAELMAERTACFIENMPDV
ncbi:MAG: SCO family protein [Paracoccaceae bacterium]